MLVTIPFRPFPHLLDPADQIACLERVWKHLQPGGRLTFTSGDGRAMQRHVRRLEHDRARQVVHMELIFTDVQSGERTVAPLDMRYFFRYEMEHLLARCGFRVMEVLGDFDGSAPGGAARELIVTAEKP